MQEYLYYLVLLFALVLSFLLFLQVRKILKGKEETEREKKEILREFLRLKKSAKPTKFTCFSCGKTYPISFGSVCLSENGKGEVVEYEVLCSFCLEKKGKAGLPLERYAGKLEKFYKEAVFPFRLSEKALKSLLKTFRAIYRVNEENGKGGKNA